MSVHFWQSTDLYWVDLLTASDKPLTGFAHLCECPSWATPTFPGFKKKFAIHPHLDCRRCGRGAT